MPAGPKVQPPQYSRKRSRYRQAVRAKWWHRCGLLEGLGKIDAMQSDPIKMLRKMLSKGRCKLQEDFCEALTRACVSKSMEFGRELLGLVLGWVECPRI